MELGQYFLEVLTPWHLAVLSLGTLGGLLLGATPGLSPTLAVALLIPFTFSMEPAPALILLGAVYTGTVAGGAISAILLNIPGAPANIATTLDGHPMAKAGRGAEALHCCFLASFVGGLVGVLVLIFFTPPLAELSLRFGPSHLFWLAILGVTVIGSLGGDSVLKGLLAGAAGLWLATIGYDPVLGEERFVYSEHLTGGIHIITALIGLFAIPQVLGMLESGRVAYSARPYQVGAHRLVESVKTTLSRWRALSIGSVVGTLVGLVPGAGGQIAGLLAYDQARRLSPNRDRFGRGEPEAVIAAESANNAMVGPSLVPLLTLGIPGSPTAAVLLGGLLIHGLFPGPSLFTAYADVTWTFIGSLLLGQVLMMVFGLYLSHHLLFVTRVPQHYMAAAVTVLAVFGAYSIQNSVSDVLVMLTLGTAMYFASKVGISPAPIVLGVILGPIAETNYVQGKLIAGAGEGLAQYFLTGALNLLLICLCVASVGYSLITELLSRRQRRVAT